MKRIPAIVAGVGCAVTVGCTSVEPPERLPADLAVYIEQAKAVAPAAAPEDQAPLDVKAAIALALRSDPDLQALRAESEIARAAARTVEGLRDPELRLSYGESEDWTDRSWLVPRSDLVFPLAPDTQDPMTASGNRFQGVTADSDAYRIGVRFFPPNPFLLRAQARMDRANYAAALSELRSAEWTISCEIRRLFATAEYLQKDVELLRRLEAARRDLADRLNASAAVPLADAVAAAQRHVQTLTDIDRGERDRQAALDELELVIGRRAGDLVFEADRPPPIDRLGEPPWRDLKERALRERSDVAAAYWRLQAARGELSEARLARMPWFSHIEGSYSEATRREHPDTALAADGGLPVLDPFTTISIDDEETTEWRIEAAVVLPFFSLGAGVTRVQRVARGQAQDTLGSITRRALSQVDQAAGALVDCLARSADRESSLRPRLEETRRLLEEMGNKPGVPPGDVVRILEVSIEIERTLLRGRHDEALALIRLDESLGLSLQPD